MFTGDAPPDERTADWERATVILATPQVIKNDLIAGRYTLADVTLMIVDECHRAVGNYAYVFLAQRYLSTANKPLLLAMTASPGGVQEKVQEVCSNLGIEHVETRTENDPDVRPYVFERDLEFINIDLPPDLKAAIQVINGLIEERLALLASLHFTVPKRDKLTMKALNAINAQIQQRIQNRDPAGYSAASVYAECMKLKHAVTLAESQGSEVLRGYLAKLIAEGTGSGGSKASQRLAADQSFRELFERSVEWTKELHPKMEIALGLVREQLETHPDSRIIIFATYRDTVQLLVDYPHCQRDRLRAVRRAGHKGRREGALPEEADRCPEPLPRRGVQSPHRNIGRRRRPRRAFHRHGDLLRGSAFRDPLHPAQGADRQVRCRPGGRPGNERHIR